MMRLSSWCFHPVAVDPVDTLRIIAFTIGQLFRNNTVSIPDVTDQQVVTLSYIVAVADDNFVATLHRLQSDGAQIITVLRVQYCLSIWHDAVRR